MIHLPVSQTEVRLRPPTGADDLQLLEMAGNDPLDISVAWLDALGQRADGSPLDAASLPLTDLEWLLLEQRRLLLGEEITARSRCIAARCGALTDIGFRIGEYLAHHQPRIPKQVKRAELPGWFRLCNAAVLFRPPTGADVAAVRRLPHPEKELARRSLHPETASAVERRRVERALEALAPGLSGEVEGRCPECGMISRFWFDVHGYIQRELRFDAELLYEDVNLLAGRYHWEEQRILALPRARRVHYAELALRGAN
jgi:hypothetical protein